MTDLATIQELSVAGRHKECLQACQNILHLNPEETYAYKYAGKSFFALEQFEKAQQFLARAHKLDGSDPEITKDIGNTFLNLGNKDIALEWYEKALKINSHYAPAFHNIANLKSQSGNHQEAIVLFNQAIQADPKLLQAYVGAAASFLILGDFDQAESFAVRALAINVRTPVVNEIRGIICQIRSKPHQAIECYQKELEVNPQASKSLLNLGILLLQLGQPVAAIESLVKVSTFAPSKQCALLLAQAYQNLGQFNEAIVEYQKLDIVKSNNHMIPFNLGLCLLNIGNNIDAIQAFKIAVLLDDSFFAAWGNLGNALKSEGRLKEARQAIEKVLSLDPDNATAHMNLAGIYQELGNLNQALALTLKSLELNPLNPDALMNLGGIHKDLGQLDEGLAATFKSLELKPNNPDALMNLGGIYKDLGQLDQALSSTLKSIQINPENPTAHMNLGGIYKDLGQLDDALAATIKSLELKPFNPDALMNLGGIYKELGQPDQALAATLKSIELKPDNPTAHMNLGAIYKNLAQYDQASASTLKSLELKPNNPDALISLGEIYKDLDMLDKALASTLKSIGLKPDHAIAYLQKGIINLYLGNIDDAKLSLEKSIALGEKKSHSRMYLAIAEYIRCNYGLADRHIKAELLLNPNYFFNKILEKLIKEKCCGISQKKQEVHTGRRLNIIFPVVRLRPVEPGLIDALYGLETIELENNKRRNSRGNASTSNFRLFEENKLLFSTLEADLIILAEREVGGKVYIQESWFTILRDGGSVRKHIHSTDLHRIKGFNLAEHQFALVYYLEVGDQACSQPGILRFYEPDRDLLPFNGMVTIFPASRPHSVDYNGSKDRVMIAINFWSI